MLHVQRHISIMIMLRRAIVFLLCIPAIAGLMVAAIGVEGDFEAFNDDGSCAADDVDVVPNWRKARAKCEDLHQKCKGWASMGDCANNPNYMLVYCPISCNSCPGPLDLSNEEEDLFDAVAKYGESQYIVGTNATKIIGVIRKTVNYMQNNIHGIRLNSTKRMSEKILNACTNREALCAFWAAVGECEANKDYMQTKCSPSCQTCETIDVVDPVKGKTLDYQNELELARKEIEDLKMQLSQVSCEP